MRHPVTAERRVGAVVRCAAAAGCALAAGCDGMQSALAPAGRDAEQIAQLFTWMGIGALLIWAIVVALGIYSVRVAPGAHSPRAARLLIVGGGVVFPTVVLAVLLGYGLWLMPRVLAVPEDGAFKVAVAGHMWWWRVQYLRDDGSTVETANEIRLPVGRRTGFVLSSPDVIHSFWVPSLAGKMDMIPGRVTRLALEPTRTGTFRGACAEFCGASHAFMSFYVVVMEPSAFEAWLDAQAAPAAEPAAPEASRGRAAFMANGCGACHTIRGTEAAGTLGPDLTHVGSRLSLGAGILANQPDEMMRWIARTEDVKPGVHMPAFGMLEEDDLRALAAYLESLE